MTERSPSMPAPFQGTNYGNSTEPNPRTVRGCDMTWFNTRGDKIIKSNYSNCSGNLETHMYPWGVVANPQNVPFNLKSLDGKGECNMLQRFDLSNSNVKKGYKNPN